MASSLLLLLDDIATILDDVSVMTKVAAKKTAGVLGDDLALNAEQVSGVRADRELPVVWAVAKGSVRNKLILVPAALAISAFLPWAVTPLLMAGGLFLCYEGFEKVAHKLLHDPQKDDAHHAALRAALVQSGEALLAVEKDKIKRRDPHGLHPVRRDHRHRARNGRRPRARKCRSACSWASQP